MSTYFRTSNTPARQASVCGTRVVVNPTIKLVPTSNPAEALGSDDKSAKEAEYNALKASLRAASDNGLTKVKQSTSGAGGQKMGIGSSTYLLKRNQGGGKFKTQPAFVGGGVKR